MDAQNIADQQRLSGRACRADDAPSGLQRVGQRLLAENMRACRESLQGHDGVMLRISANRDGVGTQGRERLVEPFETRQTGKLGFEVVALCGARGAKADQFELLDRPVGASVAGSHGAEASHENADALRGRNG